MKTKLLKTIVFFWTILSFLVDIFLAIASGNFTTGTGIVLITIELIICWIAYRMLKEKRWALILLTIFYGLRSLNIHTNDFSFYTTSGVNIELGIGSAVSLNLITFVFFVLLIFEITRSRNSAVGSTEPTS